MIRSPGHVYLAFPLAATVGAAVVGLEIVGYFLFGYLIFHPDEIDLAAWTEMGLLAFAFAWPFFLTGLALVGGPVWWLLHRKRKTSRHAALIAGGVGAALLGPPLAALFFLGTDNIGFLAFLGLGLIVPGGLAGLTAHAVAYKSIITPAATVSSTDTTIVHVRLFDEGTDVWRPVEAERLGETTYRLAADPVPADERWSFQPGDIVVVERRGDQADEPLIAVAKATDFDAPSWASRRKVEAVRRAT